MILGKDCQILRKASEQCLIPSKPFFGTIPYLI